MRRIQFARRKIAEHLVKSTSLLVESRQILSAYPESQKYVTSKDAWRLRKNNFKVEYHYFILSVYMDIDRINILLLNIEIFYIKCRYAIRKFFYQ